MVLGLSPVAVTQVSDIAPVSIKEVLDIQGTIERRFTLKRVRDMMRTYSQFFLYDRDLHHERVKMPSSLPL